MSYTKLLVSWKGPISKNNYLVGVLNKWEKTYTFYYNLAEVNQARNEGFKPFIGLSDIDKEYNSEKLFPVFERRLPHQSRAVFKKFIEKNKLDTSDDINWIYLSIIGGRLATDSLSFLSPIIVNKGKLYFTFDVAGWSYTKDNNRPLQVDDELAMQIDEKNPKDKYAVELIDPQNNNQRVGYIPRPFNKFFHRVIGDNYLLNSVIVGIMGDDARPAVFASSINSNFDLNNYKEFLYLIDTRSNEDFLQE